MKQPAPQAMFRFHRQFLLLSSGWAWLAVAQAQRNALLHALCGNGPGNVTDYTCFVTLVDACVPGVHKVKVTCLPTVQAFVAALHRQISALLWSAPVEAIGVANKWRHEVWDKTEGFQDWVALDDDEQLELVFKVRASRKEVPIKAPTTPSPAGPPTPPTAAPLPPPTALPSAPANAPSTMPPITPLVAPHGNDHQPLCTMNPASEAPDAASDSPVVAGQNSGLPVQAAQRGPSMMGDHQPLCPMDPASEAPDAASDNPVPARQNSGLPVRAAQRGPSVMSMMDDNDSKPQSPRPTARMMDDQNGPSAPITSVNVRAVKGRFGREPYTWQIQVWEALAQRKDALVVVPTGAGKSLCYQAYTTATGKKGCCLVVSPLVSLMVNQVEQQLQPLHFDAIFLGSQQTCATTKRVLDDCIQGVRQLPDFVYVTPEYLCGTENELRMLRSRFALFAVDEVHEVLDSSTYREAFTQLPKVLRSLSSGEVPIILTSATIRKQDTGHLQQMFSMTSTCHTFFRPMDRTDLALSFRQKKGKPEEDLGWLPTCDGKTIVFCTSKADRPDSAEEIADMLNKVGTATIARPYHKDLSQHDREKALADFTNGVITVLVVTSALSVGFDTDGVKRVIFYGVPSTLNTWVQVAGRCARRPHEKGDIHVFWTFKDFNIFSFYYGNIERNVHREDVATAQERVLTNAKNMFRLYSTCGCYRRWLATFYGVELVDGDCGECSNCKQGAPQDMTDLAFQILTRLPRNQLLLITHLKFLLLGRSSGYMTKMNWDADFKSSMALPDKWKALPESTILAVLYALIDKGLVDLVVEYNKHNMSFKVGTIDNGCQWVANSNREPILCHATHGKPMQTGTQKRSLPAVRQLIGTDTSTHIDVIEANEDECLNKVQLNRVYVAKEPLPLGTGPHHLFHNLNVCHDKVTVTTAVKVDMHGKRVWRMLNAKCNGVRTCNTGQCHVAPVAHTKGCIHGRTKTENCPCVTYSFWHDDGIEVLVVYSPDEGGHNHAPPRIHKWNSTLEGQLAAAFSDGKSMVEVEGGAGLSSGVIPTMLNPNYAGGERLKKVKYKGRAMANSFGTSRTKFVSTHTNLCKLHAKSREYDTKVPKSHPYVLDVENTKAPVFMSPAQIKTMRDARFWEIDAQYPSLSGAAKTHAESLPFLTNIHVYWERYQKWAVTTRVFTQAISEAELAPPLQKVFQSIKEAHPEWKITNIVTIVLDFSEAQLNALIAAIREHAKNYPGDFADKTVDDFINELFRGCEVHWLRSVRRVALVLRRSHGDGADEFRKMCEGIPNAKSPAAVAETLDAIVKKWSATGSWARWWNREKVLKMLSFAYSGMTFFEWTRNATSNAAESGNRPVAELSNASQWDTFECAWEEDKVHGIRRHAVSRMEDYCPNLVCYGRKQKANNKSGTHANAAQCLEAEESELWENQFENDVWTKGREKHQGDNVVTVLLEPSLDARREPGLMDLEGVVRGSRDGAEYTVTATLDFSGCTIVTSGCACLSRKVPCHHVAAALLKALSTVPQSEPLVNKVRKVQKLHRRDDYRSPDFDTQPVPQRSSRSANPADSANSAGSDDCDSSMVVCLTPDDTDTMDNTVDARRCDNQKKGKPSFSKLVPSNGDVRKQGRRASTGVRMGAQRGARRDSRTGTGSKGRQRQRQGWAGRQEDSGQPP